MLNKKFVSFLALLVMFVFSTVVISFYPAYTLFIRSLSLILFFMNCVLLIVNLPDIYRHKILLLLALLACIFPFFTLSLGFYREQYFLDNMASVMHIYNLILFIILTPSICLPDKYIKVLLFIPVIGLIFLISYYHIFDFIVSPYFWPPNDVVKSYFYMFICLILWNSISKSSNFWTFLWLIVLFVLSYRIECRSGLLATVCFVLLCVFDCWITNPFIYRSILNGLVIGSIVFAATYVYLYLNFFRMDLSWAFQEAGKGVFSGRERIWLELFAGLKEHPILGIGREGLVWSVSWNTGDTHNSAMYVLCLFGMPVAIILLTMLNRVFSYFKLILQKDIVSRRALYAFFSMLVMGFFESNVVTTPFVIFTFFMLFIINSRNRNYKVQK